VGVRGLGRPRNVNLHIGETMKKSKAERLAAETEKHRVRDIERCFERARLHQLKAQKYMEKASKLIEQGDVNG